jgi:hypothetical protein
MAAYFKDLNKRLSDLITKEFPGEKQENKVVWTGTTANNVSFETNFVQRKDGSILGTLIPKYVYKPWGTTFSAEINTKKDVKVEVAVAEKLAPGLKTTVTANSKADGNFGTLAVDYKQEHGTLSIAADYGKQNGSLVNAAAVVAHQNWSIGAKADYLLGITTDSDLLEFQANLGYSSDEFDVQAFGRVKSLGEEDKHELGATYFHRINNDLSVGTEVVFDVSASGANKPKLTFASQYRLENDTILKGKFDTEGRLGLSYQQKFSRNAKLTIGAAIDANNLNKNSSTFGFTLNLSD